MIDHPSQAVPSLDDYRWLVEGHGQEWLEMAMNSELSLGNATKRLRRDLTAMQTHLVLEQTELRARARQKFPAADRMFFTAKSLEQSTAEPIASYKAARFSDSAVADLCCGIGGDLLGLARRGPAIGVERDQVLAYLAQANCRAMDLSAAVSEVDAEQIELDPFPSIHIDPDRRPSGNRSIRLENHQPAEATLKQLCTRQDNVAIKLAPATEIDSWLSTAELEWIGSRRECQQLVAWYGSVATQAGYRRATVITTDGPLTIVGQSIALEHTDQVDRYVIEPHAAVLAADLAGQLAETHHLQSLTRRGGYLTGSTTPNTRLAAGYEVTDVLAYRPKRIRAILRQRQIGNLVVKKRGVTQTPAQVQRECLPTPCGDGQAVLILTKIGQRVTAVLAKGEVRRGA